MNQAKIDQAGTEDTDTECQPVGISDSPTYSIEGNGSRGSHLGNGYKESDVMYTLNTIEQHGVCYGFQGQSGASIGMPICEDTAPTMVVNQVTNVAQTSVEPILLESNQNHATIQTDGVSTTLPASMGEGGGYVPMVTQPNADKQSTVYGISSYDSNAMKSDNPHSGFYEADTARTLDLNGGNPACNQGGMAVVQPTSELSDKEKAQVQDWLDAVNASAKHQQDLIQSDLGVARTIAPGTHASGPHLTKTLVTGVVSNNSTAFGIDQQGGKGQANFTVDVAPTMAADSHGTPHAVCYGVTAKGNGDAFINPNTHTALSTGGGEPGQGYPCVLQVSTSEDTTCLNPWDVQSKHIQPENGIAESLYAGECRYGGGESYVLQNTSAPDSMAFAQNEREEVRDLNDVASALSAEPGTHQQTYVAQKVRNDNGVGTPTTYQETTGALCAARYSKLGTQEAMQDMFVVQSMEVFHCTTENDMSHPLKARDYKDPQIVAYTPSSIDEKIKP